MHYLCGVVVHWLYHIAGGEVLNNTANSAYCKTCRWVQFDTLNFSVVEILFSMCLSFPLLTTHGRTRKQRRFWMVAAIAALTCLATRKEFFEFPRCTLDSLFVLQRLTSCGHAIVRGFPYITSAVGEGVVPRKQMKGTKSADLWQWKGGGGPKIRKFCGRHIWKPPYCDH